MLGVTGMQAWVARACLLEEQRMPGMAKWQVKGNGENNRRVS